MTFAFKPATKKNARGRAAFIGPAGSGKTYTMLKVATAMCNRVAVIDTEHGSASKYANLFQFEVLELDSFSPETYVKAIDAAEAAGFDGLVIDSLSHAWMGKDGALEMVDREAARSRSGNSFAAWRNVTPMHNRLVEAMIACRAHLFVSMRTKTEYVIQENDRGKKEPKKIGLAPVQRDGLEYEFDVVCDVDLDHNIIVGKTRCPELDGKTFHKAGKDFADVFSAWLTDGVEAPAPARQPVNEAPRKPGSGTPVVTNVSPHLEPDEEPDAGFDHNAEGDEIYARLMRELDELAENIAQCATYDEVLILRGALGGKGRGEASNLTLEAQRAREGRIISPDQYHQLGRKWQKNDRELEKQKKRLKPDAADSFTDPDPGAYPDDQGHDETGKPL